MLEAELNEYMGYGSLVYLCEEKEGEGDVLPSIPGLMDRACNEGALALWCSGLVVRLLDRGKVFEMDEIGEAWDRSRPESSNSSFSGMLGSMLRPLQDGPTGYESSKADRRGLLLRDEDKGDIGLLEVP